MDTEKLIHTLTREYLRSLKLTGTLESLGLDCTFFHVNLIDVITELMGFKETPDAVCKIVNRYQRKISNVKFYEFPDRLMYLASEMVCEINGLKEANRI